MRYILTFVLSYIFITLVMDMDSKWRATLSECITLDEFIELCFSLLHIWCFKKKKLHIWFTQVYVSASICLTVYELHYNSQLIIFLLFSFDVRFCGLMLTLLHSFVLNSLCYIGRNGAPNWTWLAFVNLRSTALKCISC